MKKMYTGIADIIQVMPVLRESGKACTFEGMNPICERILVALKKKGMSPYRLAKELGITPQSVYEWTKEGKPPDRKRMKDLANVLDVSPAWLEFGEGTKVITGGKAKQDSNVASFTLSIKQVPLISWVTAGQWAEVSDNYPPGQGEEIIPCPAKCGPHSFALRVKGDSMSPEYPEGAVIVVDPDREPRHNSDVVARLNSDMEATFKRLKIDGSRWYLHPINERYPVIPLDGKDYTICGVVVWVGREVS